MPKVSPSTSFARLHRASRCEGFFTAFLHQGRGLGNVGDVSRSITARGPTHDRTRHALQPPEGTLPYVRPLHEPSHTRLHELGRPHAVRTATVRRAVSTLLSDAALEPS